MIPAAWFDQEVQVEYPDRQQSDLREYGILNDANRHGVLILSTNEPEQEIFIPWTAIQSIRLVYPERLDTEAQTREDAKVP